jgi:ankyrin repeat protein
MLKLRSLAELKNPGEVKKSLMNLPNTYDEIYEFNIKRIENQDEVHRERAFQVLSWLSYALAPLTVTALQHALLVKSGDVELRKDAQPDDNALVSICADLVVIDPETNIIRLVHETAQDYLKKVRPKKFPDGHSIISSASLAYLSLGEFSELCSSQIEVDKRSEKYPFYRYAAQYWPQHVNLGGLESSLQGLIVAFLGSRQRYSADEVMASHRWSVWGSDNAGPWTDWNRLSIQRRDHPQHAAATYGLLNTLNFLLNKRGYKIDQPNNFGETALHRAAQVGHATIIEELLASGAELNAKVKQHYLGQATPMILASKCLQVDAVRVLSNYGADVNSFDPQNRYIPLHFAASTSTELTRILLDHGAYPNFQAIRSPSFPERGPMTSLHFSVYFSHAYEGARDRVKLLLDRGANVNAQTGLGNTALHIAILGGHQGLLDLLLQRGADVQLKNMEGKSVPQLAQELGHFSWVKGQVPRQILDDQLRKTPALHQAIWDKDHPLILRLLKQGADIAEKDESGNTPWDYCLMSTNLDLAKILVDHMYSNNLPKQIGSEAFDKGITQMTAFDYTDIKTWEGTLQICRLLLPFRKAFDGDLQFAKARSPLPFPRAFDGALQLAKAPSPPIGYNKTFFIWAAELGRTSLVEFLLECGADVNAQDIYGSTATHYAVSGNNIEIVNILVKNGANLRLQARNGHTPVMGADTGGFFKMKTYLEAALAVQADQS